MTRFQKTTRIGVCALGLVLALAGSALATHTDGEITIRNDRGVTAHILVDGDAIASVPAHGSLVLGGVRNGVREITVSSAGLPTWTTQLAVPPDGQAMLRISGYPAPAAAGSALIHNLTGRDVRVVLDNIDLGVLRAGAHLATSDLTPGLHRMTTTSIDGAGVTMTQTFEVGYGDRANVDVAAGYGSGTGLVVANPYSRTVTVLIDGNRAGTLYPGESMRVPGLYPGDHEVTYLIQGGGTKITSRIDVATVFEPRYQPVVAYQPTAAVQPGGSLAITNTAAVPVDVNVDKQVLGVLRPGETRIVRNLQPGTYMVQARLPDGRNVVRFVRARVGNTEAIQLEPPRGIRRVEVRPAIWP